MSAWPIPDEVVLHRLHVALRDWADIGGEDALTQLRSEFERHRLVQLPEEPSAWDVEWYDNHEPGMPEGTIRSLYDDPWTQEDTYEEARDVAASCSRYATTGRIRPVYRIPGQPITVDKEERDGDE